MPLVSPFHGSGLPAGPVTAAEQAFFNIPGLIAWGEGDVRCMSADGTKLYDRKTFQPYTVSGTLKSSSPINAATPLAVGQGVAGIQVSAAGSGGTTGTYSVVFTGVTTGATAPTALYVVNGGSISSIVMTGQGSGLASMPTPTFPSGGITGVTATCISNQFNGQPTLLLDGGESISLGNIMPVNSDYTLAVVGLLNSNNPNAQIFMAGDLASASTHTLQSVKSSGKFLSNQNGTTSVAAATTYATQTPYLLVQTLTDSTLSAKLFIGGTLSNSGTAGAHNTDPSLRVANGNILAAPLFGNIAHFSVFNADLNASGYMATLNNYLKPKYGV